MKDTIYNVPYSAHRVCVEGHTMTYLGTRSHGDLPGVAVQSWVCSCGDKAEHLYNY